MIPTGCKNRTSNYTIIFNQMCVCVCGCGAQLTEPRGGKQHYTTPHVKCTNVCMLNQPDTNDFHMLTFLINTNESTYTHTHTDSQVALTQPLSASRIYGLNQDASLLSVSGI